MTPVYIMEELMIMGYPMSGLKVLCSNDCKDLWQAGPWVRG